MQAPADLYTNDNHWQEYECPGCASDFDVFPPQRPGTQMHCSGCGLEWLAPEHSSTYIEVPVTEDNEQGVGYVARDELPPQ